MFSRKINGLLLYAPYSTLFDTGILQPRHVSGLLGQHLFATTTSRAKIHKNSNLQHFCYFRKLSRPKFWILIQMLNVEIFHNLILGWILGKFDQWQSFFKRPELWCSCGSTITSNLPKCLKVSSWCKKKTRKEIINLKNKNKSKSELHNFDSHFLTGKHRDLKLSRSFFWCHQKNKILWRFLELANEWYFPCKFLNKVC